MTFPTEQPHGPVCIGLDAGCPDCQRIHSVGIGAGRQRAATPATIQQARRDQLPATTYRAALQISRVARELVQAIELASGADLIGDDIADAIGSLESDYFAQPVNDGPLPRPTPEDLERWNTAARDVPGPMGRCIRILLGEIERLQNENESLTTKPERP